MDFAALDTAIQQVELVEGQKLHQEDSIQFWDTFAVMEVYTWKFKSLKEYYKGNKNRAKYTQYQITTRGLGWTKELQLNIMVHTDNILVFYNILKHINIS